MVEPSFVEGLVRLDVQQLGLPAEVVDVRSLAVTLVEHPFVLVGQSVEGLLTEIVEVPHLVAGPEFVFGDELAEALGVDEYRRADLGAETPAGRADLVVGIGVVGEVIARVVGSPRTAARKVSFVRIGLVVAFAAVEDPDIFAQVGVQRRFGPAFVVAAPDGDRRVVAQPLDLFDGVVVEGVDVVGKNRVRIEPEIVPYHDAVLVAGFVELLVGGGAQPVADHVEIHLFVQSYLGEVFLAAAAEHVLRKSPVRTFDEDAAVVDPEVEHAVLGVVVVFFQTEGYPLRVGGFAVDLDGQVAGVEVGFAVAVGPPQERIVDRERRAFAFVETQLGSASGLDVDTGREPDIARHDHAAHLARSVLFRVVAHSQPDADVGTGRRGQFAADPWIGERQCVARRKIHLVRDA